MTASGTKNTTQVDSEIQELLKRRRLSQSKSAELKSEFKREQKKETDNQFVARLLAARANKIGKLDIPSDLMVDDEDISTILTTVLAGNLQYIFICRSLTEKSLQELSALLMKTTKLTEFHLAFPPRKGTSLLIIPILSSVTKSASQIEKLYLSSIQFDDTTASYLNDLINKQGLKQLVFCNCSFTEQALAAISHKSSSCQIEVLKGTVPNLEGPQEIKKPIPEKTEELKLLDKALSEPLDIDHLVSANKKYQTLKNYWNHIKELDQYIQARKNETRYCCSRLFGYSEQDYELRKGYMRELRSQTSWDKKLQTITDVLGDTRITGGRRHKFGDILKKMQQEIIAIQGLQVSVPQWDIIPLNGHLPPVGPSINP